MLKPPTRLGISPLSHWLFLWMNFSPPQEEFSQQKPSTNQPETIWIFPSWNLWLPGILWPQIWPPTNLQATLRDFFPKWMFPKIVGFPPNHPFEEGFPFISPSILGYHYFWKHPNGTKKHGLGFVVFVPWVVPVLYLYICLP